MVSVRSNNLIEIAKKVGTFAIFLAMLNVVLGVILMIPNFISGIGWVSEPGDPTINSIYESQYNNVTKEYEIKLDEGVPVLSKEWLKYQKDKEEREEYIFDVLALFSVLFGGIFTLAIVLESLGLDLGKFAGFNSSSKSGKGGNNI